MAWAAGITRESKQLNPNLVRLYFMYALFENCDDGIPPLTCHTQVNPAEPQASAAEIHCTLRVLYYSRNQYWL
jgi:hypothetical protein